jgi:hypothetical protein
MPSKLSHARTFWHNQQFLLLALHEEEDDNNTPEQFYMLLDEEGHCCCNRLLLQMTLLLPTKEMTPWKKVYTSGHDPALITVTGLDYECLESHCSSFNLILMLLLPG